jgi:predicted enzyme related to lactoylglutathione lyase
MDNSIRRLLEDFESGKISRRKLLQALGLAAAATVPANLIGQQTPPAGAAGRAGGGGRGADANVPRVPIARPFANTGWKTVWLDKLEYECVDAETAAAFYIALMDWRLRSTENGKFLLDMGDAMGGIEIRGGMTAPPPAAITDAGLGVSRPPVRARFTGFAWGIDQWDAGRVRAALQERGLNPVEDNSADGAYQSFRIKDPMGFDVAITNGNKANRRATNANGRLTMQLPFEPTNWRTLYVDHISYEVSDVAKTAGFYAALLGWNAPADMAENAAQVGASMGDGGIVAGSIIRGNAAARAAVAAARGGGAGRAGGAGGGGAAAGGGRAANVAPGGPSAAIGHISFGIADWNTERMRYEFIKRGVVYVNQQGQKEPRPDFTGNLQSYHVPDAMGWDLQIGNKIGPSTWGE